MAILNSEDARVLLVIFVACTSFYFIGLGFQRLVLSPYAKYPGPKLAGLTDWYTIYYDVFPYQGQYMWKIKEMHEKYGPVVRIRPNEVHISYPDFYDVLFANSPHIRNKTPAWNKAVMIDESVFGATDHYLHRSRRAALNPFFAPSQIRILEDLINEMLTKLFAVMRSYKKAGNPVPLRAAFTALTSDIINQYCFGYNEGYLEKPGFNAVIMESTDALIKNVHLGIHWHWTVAFFQMLPTWLAVYMVGPGGATLSWMQNHAKENIRRIIKENEKEGSHTDMKHRTIFHEILNSKMPESEKSVSRLAQEGQLLLSAGTATTATTLANALLYLFLDPDRLKILMAELEEAIPNLSKLTYTQLEKLPYLTGTVNETMRLTCGVSFRLGRSAPNETLECSGYTFPPGTQLCMHNVLMHYNPDVFPSPDSFLPERWTKTPSPGIPKASTRHLAPFSKGTRHCAAMPLAYAEVYMALASFLRNFVRIEDGEMKGARLYKSDRRDVHVVGDSGFPIIAKGRGNIQVILED